MNAFRFTRRREKGAVPLAALLLAFLFPPLLAAQPPCVTGLGTRVIALGGPVTVRILPPGADFTSEISVLKNGATVGEFRFPLGSSQDAGAEVDAGTFVANAELRFFIDVQETGYDFSTGPASRNLDGLAHATVTQIDEDTVRVGFEDFLGTSDRDFDDVRFEVDGAHPQIYFAGLPAEPGDESRLQCDEGGNLVASPFQVGGGFDLSLPLGENGGVSLVGPSRGTPGERHLEILGLGIGGAPSIRLRRDDAGATVGGTVLSAGFALSSATLPFEVEMFRNGVLVDRVQTPGRMEDGLVAVPANAPPCGLGQFLDSELVVTKTIFEGICRFSIRDRCTSPSANDSFDETRVTADDPDLRSCLPLGRFGLSGSGYESFAIQTQSLFRFGNRHTALGVTEFHSSPDGLTLSELGATGADGVSIDLGTGIETFETTWKPLPLVGLSLAGSEIHLASLGRFEGEDDRDLGTLRLRQTDGKVRVEADYAAVGSPTHRIVILDRGSVVADVRSHAGIVAHLTAWPSGAGKGRFTLPDLSQTPCYTLPLPPDTWIDVPGGPKALGDRMLVLAEGAGSVGGVSRFDLRASGLPTLSIADEQVTLEPAPPPPAACVPSARRLCLGEGKFAAELSWRDAAGRTRTGEAVPLTREAGYFRFDDPARPEVAVKLFDGRASNGHWWVYEGGLSRREYRLTVIDLEHGTSRVYEHPKGRFASRLDDRAFAAGGAVRAASRPFDLPGGESFTAAVATGAGAAGGCVATATRLCLAGGRFEVEAIRRAAPRTRANTVPLGDAAGYFFFAEAANADLFVKAVPKPDGGWAIVRGSLTRSPFALRVRDRATGETRLLR